MSRNGSGKAADGLRLPSAGDRGPERADAEPAAVVAGPVFELSAGTAISAET